jgi:hypothetical protein
LNTAARIDEKFLLICTEICQSNTLGKLLLFGISCDNRRTGAARFPTTAIILCAALNEWICDPAGEGQMEKRRHFPRNGNERD